MIETDKELAVLTRAGTQFGVRFLKKLAENGVRPGVIIVEYTPFSARWKMAKFLARKIGFMDAMRYNLKFWTPLFLRFISFGRLKKLPDYHAYSNHVVKVKNINDPQAVEALTKLKIKKVILAQSGIIRKPILDIKDLWIVNCHPGRLPYYRGVDVVRWALLEQQPIEVTLHNVDSGIDTGNIIKSEKVNVYQEDSIADVERRSIDLSINMLIEAALNGPLANNPKQENNKLMGKQYYLMPFKKVRELESNWLQIRNHYSDKGI